MQQVCTCGAPLLARYDLKEAAKTFHPQSLRQREANMWRYTELLPLRNPDDRVSLNETITLLAHFDRTGSAIGMRALTVKDEGALPTGSFKARGAAVGVSKARELGVKAFAMPTNGNAGGAWSAYGSRAQIESYIVMPKDAPQVNRLECVMAGAHLWLIDGLISDAGRIVQKAIAQHKFYDASTLREPYRIEGKKTMGFEIAEQYDWRLPDVILYPMGGGVGLIGIYKAFCELRDMGIIAPPFPRFVAVQAEGCAPIVQAWQQRKNESVAWQNSSTVAFGINVPKALGDFIALSAIYETKGCAVAVSDPEILDMQKRIAREEGFFICPEGAASVAAAAKLRTDGWIGEDERVLAINTATGVKTPNLPLPQLPLLARDGSIDI